MTQKRILIVEDEKPMATALSLKLGSAGFKTHVVYDGNAAIAAIKETEYDLILVDLVLPKVDGFAVLEELKRLNIKTPIIVISNLSQAEDVKRVKDLGVSNYIVKSNTTLAAIIDHVKTILNFNESMFAHGQ